MSNRPDADDRDLDAWLDGLRGRPVAGSPASHEAATQREAIAAAHATRASEPQDPQELQRLLFRLRREGLLGAGADAAAQPGRTTRWRLPAAAAAVLALGLALTMIGPGLWHGGDEPVLRSGGAVQVLEVLAADVASTAQRLATALKAAGADVVIADTHGGGREVAATVPKERLADAAAALTPFALKPPAADGSLRIDVRPRAATAP
jgi:hypothetical protein